jgi:hypothetical protein
MKYPKTYHLPWSKGITRDDRVVKNIDHLIGRNVVITEKLDGENTSLLAHKTHARSEDSQHHPSRDWIKGYWAERCYKIPIHIQVVGENMFAQHSIPYTKLTTYFYGFGAFENGYVMSWEDTLVLFKQLNIESVPVLYKGTLKADTIEMLMDIDNLKPTFSDELEGYVIRPADGFKTEDHALNVLKYVREGHVQTDIHWTKQWKPNKLR